ncbi:SET and MYND domain-containing protein 4-like [Aphidius gifuensis]|uniref:SET and MYND domain-containing protein 4-like n=1 Tax=Aphidius gifuensis TaxID=684658 RepID=UPI001CDB66CF|nr:SET and MYND domain-containing protein 4-like [Aphidius gifuensis]
MMAHKRYTQCITHAPAGSDYLSLGYGYRGIALYFGNYMSDCLLDLERALNNGCPDGLKSEFFTWKAAAMQELGMKKSLIKRALLQAHQWIPNIHDYEEKIRIERRLETMKLWKTDKLKCYSLDFEDAALPPLKSKNRMVPGLSKSVELKCSLKYGRHVVATRDIGAGDIIGIQKPYASVVKMNMRYNICWHCKKQTWASVACNSCSQVVFCSDDCKKQAQDNYHDIECRVLSQIMAFGVCEYVYVALRLVIMAFKQSKNSFVQLKETTDKIDKSEDVLTWGFIKGKLDPTKFESVYGLCDPSSPSTMADQRYSTFEDAIIMSYYLGQRIKLFQEDRPIELLPFVRIQKDFVSIVDRFLTLAQFNSFNYSVLSTNKGVPMASLIVPSFSFFNHSCCSNIIRTYRDGNLAIIAIRPIKTGEQVFDNYGAYWFLQSREDRQKQLQRFQFTCDCQACEENWSIPEDLEAVEIVENKSFTHGGPYMNKELLGIIEKYVTVCKTAFNYIRVNNGQFPSAKLIADFTKFLNKEYKNYNNQSYEVFKVGRYIEELYVISQNIFFYLPGEIGYSPLE